jgi:hypothetical protein
VAAKMSKLYQTLTIEYNNVATIIKKLVPCQYVQRTSKLISQEAFALEQLSAACLWLLLVFIWELFYAL